MTHETREVNDRITWLDKKIIWQNQDYVFAAGVSICLFFLWLFPVHSPEPSFFSLPPFSFSSFFLSSSFAYPFPFFDLSFQYFLLLFLVKSCSLFHSITRSCSSNCNCISLIRIQLSFAQTLLPVRLLPSKTSMLTPPLVMWRAATLSMFSWASVWRGP